MLAYVGRQTWEIDVSGKNKKVDIDDAQPDMTLAEPILDARGDVLLPSGTVLTKTTLSGLQRRGIDHVVVVDDTISEEELAAERAREAERVRQQVERLGCLFRKCGSSGNAATLFRYVRAYRTGETA
jgi:hypothetical protein